MFLSKAVFLAIHSTVVLSLTCDFDLIWYEANKTEPRYYTARQEVTAELENAVKIGVNQKISVLRSFDLGFAKKLKTLTMHDCGLTDIESGSFKNLSPLTELIIAGNAVKVIKHGVFNYVDVRHLNLSHNKIRTVKPSAFDNMRNLQSLILDYNEITLYAFWFGNCPNVTTVSATFNFIQYLPEGMFRAIRTHKLNVYLSFNKIQKMHPDAFDVDEFGDFLLDHNEISDFDYSVNKIHNLDLRDNYIECLSDEFIANELGKITVVNLKENPTNCSCWRKLKGYKNVLVETVEGDC